MSSSLAAGLLVLYACGANAIFEYRDCSPPGSKMRVTHLDISPNPILLPGDLTVSLSGSTISTIAGAKVHLSLSKKELFVINVPVPCIENVGSCDYDDICTLLNRMETEDWLGVMGNIAQQLKAMFASQGVDAASCPYEPGSVNIQNYKINMPQVAGALNWFAAGDYHVHLSFEEKSTGNTILCLEAEVHLAQDDSLCSGISCFFGRK